MNHSPSGSAGATPSQRAEGADDPSVQPADLPVQVDVAALVSPPGHADPIPPDEVPAASPLPNKRTAKRKAGGFWLSAVLMLVALLIAVAMGTGSDRGVRGPDDRRDAPAAPAP